MTIAFLTESDSKQKRAYNLDQACEFRRMPATGPIPERTMIFFGSFTVIVRETIREIGDMVGERLEG